MLIQFAEHHLEFGFQDSSVLFHVGLQSGQIFVEHHVTHLVDFVVTDGLDGNLLFDKVQVGLAARHSSHAGAGEADLGGRGKGNHHILMAGFPQLIHQVQQMVGMVGQVVDAVGVVPHNFKVRGSGIQSGKLPHHFVGVGDAGGVGVHGHAPDSLDGGIVFAEFLDHVHVRAVLVHGDVDHFKSKQLGDGKVTVVSGNRAEPLDLFFLAPRPGRVVKAKAHSPGDAVVHQIQAGVSSDKHFGFVVHAKQVAKQLAAFVDAFQYAVVAQVFTLFRPHYRLGIEHVQDGHGQIQLVRSRLPSGHI